MPKRFDPEQIIRLYDYLFCFFSAYKIYEIYDLSLPCLVRLLIAENEDHGIPRFVKFFLDLHFILKVFVEVNGRLNSDNGKTEPHKF